MVGYGAGRLNWHVLQNPLVQGCAVVYLLHSLWRHFLPEPWLLQYYLNDLLCMPLVLGAAVFVQRNLLLRRPDYGLNAYQIGMVVVYWSVMFEGVIPHFVARYTADIFDVVMYGAGGLAFYFFGNAGPGGLVKKV